jgi:general secretion pathway protein K
MPQRVRQLTWLGLRPATLAKLTPYITLLPERTTVNINTAAAEVIFAAVPGLQLSDAKLTVSSRESAHFPSIADAATKVPALNGKLQDTQHSVATRFFEVSGRIRLEQTVVEEQSLVQRDTQSNVKTLWRERAVVAAADIVSNNSVAKP